MASDPSRQDPHAAWVAAKRMLRNRRTPAPGLPLTVILQTYREQLAAEGRRVTVLDTATSAHISILDAGELEAGRATLVVRDVSNEFDVRVERIYLEADGEEVAGGAWDGHPLHLELPRWRGAASVWVLRFKKAL